jgi:hypothetical protein
VRQPIDSFAVVSCRWNFEMLATVMQSVSILSDAGLEMVMFSLERDPIPALVFVIISSCYFVYVDIVRLGR